MEKRVAYGELAIPKGGETCMRCGEPIPHELTIYYPPAWRGCRRCLTQHMDWVAHWLAGWWLSRMDYGFEPR